MSTKTEEPILVKSRPLNQKFKYNGVYGVSDNNDFGIEKVHGYDYIVQKLEGTRTKLMHRITNRGVEEYEVVVPAGWLITSRQGHSFAVESREHAERVGIILDQDHADEFGLNLESLLLQAQTKRRGSPMKGFW